MLTFDLVLKNIENNIPFSFARYGDGEWNCILSPNDQKGNCDGHKYFKDLSTSLKKLLICKPKYYLGMQNFALSLKGNEINYFLEKKMSEAIRLSEIIKSKDGKHVICFMKRAVRIDNIYIPYKKIKSFICSNGCVYNL